MNLRLVVKLILHFGRIEACQVRTRLDFTREDV